MKILLIQETDNNQTILAKAIFCLLITISISFIIMYFKVDKEKSELEARYFSIYDKPGEYYSSIHIQYKTGITIKYVDFDRDRYFIQTKFVSNQNGDMRSYLSDEMSQYCFQNLKSYYDNKFNDQFKIVNRFDFESLISDKINYNNKYFIFSPGFIKGNPKKENSTMTMGECKFDFEDYSLINSKCYVWYCIRRDFYFFTFLLFIIPLIYYIFSYFRINYLIKKKSDDN